MTNEQKLNYWNTRYNEINEKQTLLREKNAEYNNELQIIFLLSLEFYPDPIGESGHGNFITRYTGFKFNIKKI